MCVCRGGGGGWVKTAFGYVKESLKVGYNCQIYQSDSLFMARDKGLCVP